MSGCPPRATGPSAAPDRQRAWALALQLDHLRLLDRDAVAVLDAAVSVLGERDPRAVDLARFRAEHAWHAHQLEELIAALQAEAAPAEAPSALARAAMARMRAAPGDAQEALRTLAQFEALVERAYAAPFRHELPDGAALVLEGARVDERHHREWAVAHARGSER